MRDFRIVVFLFLLAPACAPSSGGNAPKPNGASSVLSTITNAVDTGTVGGGGGDICEDRIKLIRENILSWISRGGANDLALPEGITLAHYTSEMPKVLQRAHITCTDSAVAIGGTEKTCKNYFDAQNHPQVLCNRKAFLETESDSQYILIHHEYAGLAQLELNGGEESNYPISNQISAFLALVEQKKLSVHIQKRQAPNNIQANFKDFVGKYKVVKCTKEVQHDPTKPLEIEVCSNFQEAELFFGDDYQPRENGRKFFARLLKNPSNAKDFEGIDIAAMDNDVGDLCTTFYGNQYCSSKANGYIIDASIKEKDGFFEVARTLTWPDPGHYLYSKLTIILTRPDRVRELR